MRLSAERVNRFGEKNIDSPLGMFMQFVHTFVKHMFGLERLFGDGTYVRYFA
jgi:hypothetical protein